jgi:hypothetical protein
MRTTLFITALLFPALAGFAGPSPSPSPDLAPGHYGGALTEDQAALFQFKAKPEAINETARMIDSHNQTLESGNHNPQHLLQNLVSGQNRAKEMVNALKTTEMQKALEAVTGRGTSLLEQNSGLKAPVSIISGIVSLWVGNTTKLFHSEFIKVNSHVEGKNRRGEFSMESPLLNGKVRFSGSEGVMVNMNRDLQPIDSHAELNYNAKTQSVSTQISHPLGPHLDFSVGSSQIPEMNNQTDGRAKIEYKISF